ncbi:hypothetical protein MUP32_06040 [Candidatus Microgenomates bacterium]|nr:hypothetical protein [Candidatus Microgenomates bacterium]
MSEIPFPQGTKTSVYKRIVRLLPTTKKGGDRTVNETTAKTVEDSKPSPEELLEGTNRLVPKK